LYRAHRERGALATDLRRGQQMLYFVRTICVCTDNGTRLLVSVFRTGATGLETTTSGVTGRSWRFRAERA
jgi:hypothetical protein